MNQMRLVILGASGMVGGYALRYMLDHPTIERVTAIGRRKLGVSHPKLDEVLHQDFSIAVPQHEWYLTKKSVGFRPAPCDRHGHEKKPPKPKANEM